MKVELGRARSRSVHPDRARSAPGMLARRPVNIQIFESLAVVRLVTKLPQYQLVSAGVVGFSVGKEFLESSLGPSSKARARQAGHFENDR